MRSTPWGAVEVRDAHVHFFSHNFYAMLGAQKGGASAAEVCAMTGMTLPPESPEDLARLWAAELDRHGVDRACLMASLPGEEGSVARALSAVPDRFHGYFFLDPRPPDAAARAEAAFLAGFQGVCLMQAMHHFSVADECVKPVLDMAARFPKTVVFVHCGSLSVGIRDKLGLPSPFDLRYSDPFNVHSVAQRYPQLHFVIPHFGAGCFREALMVCDLCPNVYLDTSSSISWVRYLHPAPSLAQVFSSALDVAGPRRLLFGTDSSFFPRGWHAAVFEQQCEALIQVGTSAEEARLVLGGNLARLLARG
jgi:predicted TIM-barrel fold metal-dependent hydrolase